MFYVDMMSAVAAAVHMLIPVRHKTEDRGYDCDITLGLCVTRHDTNQAVFNKPAMREAILMHSHGFKEVLNLRYLILG